VNKYVFLTKIRASCIKTL